jgi:hypothetical protein
MNSRKGSMNSRKGSMNSRKRSMNSRKGSMNSRKGSMNSRKGSMNSATDVRKCFEETKGICITLNKALSVEYSDAALSYDLHGNLPSFISLGFLTG